MQARLVSTESVRDFLISKLKSAEMALKSALKEGHRLRRQQASDNEVITFLDLANQTLEGEKSTAEYTRKSIYIYTHICLSASFCLSLPLALTPPPPHTHTPLIRYLCTYYYRHVYASRI